MKHKALTGTMSHLPGFSHSGKGHNYGGQTGAAARRWTAAIGRDRNYARLLMGLPLIEPVRKDLRRLQRLIGEPGA